MVLPVHKPKLEEILKCVARFEDITPANTGLPDQEVDGYRRTFYNALGFSQPAGEGSYSPLGDDAKPLISHLSPGFNLGYVEATPGQGVMMHNHDTNETFVVISGTWMFEWEGHHGDESVILKERDIVSFEPGMQRRFECVNSAVNTDKGVILGVIGGDNPAAEFSPESIERLRELGVEVQQAAE